jgi:hypothetical protein
VALDIILLEKPTFRGSLAIRALADKTELFRTNGPWITIPYIVRLGEIALPVEAKPLFRPDALRSHLKAFQLPVIQPDARRNQAPAT